MEQPEKFPAQMPRVLHGPHRLRMSGVAAHPSIPAGDVSPSIIAGEFEVVTELVEISVELIPLDQPS